MSHKGDPTPAPAPVAADASLDQLGDRWVAAVDLGGTVVKGTLAATDRLDCPVRRTPRTANHPVEDLLGALSALMSEAKSTERSVVSVGVAVPGIVDETTGYVRRAVNLGIQDLDLRALLERELKIPVYIGHDIRCAATAERSINNTDFTESTMMVPIGTGIGAALVVDGNLLVARGYAGEIGHLDVGSGRRCACGLTGCLETVSSALAISKIYEELSGQTGVDATVIAERASQSDRAAAKAWDIAIENLSIALAATSSILGINSIIMAGGLSLAGSRLINPLRKALYRRVSPHRKPQLSTAKLKADAGCRGAALGALSMIGQMPM